MKVIFLGRSSREGKRRDGSTAVFYNVDLMVPDVGSGQVGVEESVFRSLDGVGFGTECEVEVSARVWSGKIEFRPVAVRVSKARAA